MKKPFSAFLRDYQKDTVDRVHEEWHRHRSVMVQMPTGTGKTHVLASIVSAFSGKVLIVAHRVELVEQIKSTVDVFEILRRNTPLDDKNIESKINVSSIQTISRRLGELDAEPDLVIIDEAHHALARTYRILWDKWPEAKFLGLTATPCRMNRAGFTDLFDTLVTSWSMAEFIRKGVLSAFDYVSIRPDSLEQQLVNSLQKRSVDGDYQVKEMDAVLNKRPSIERLYDSLKEFAGGKKGIVYAISIDHARSIAEYYSEQGIRTVAIDSKTPREERRGMVEAFRRGEIEVMVNVDVFSEGFDCPDVEFVQMARPTLSLSKYLQQVGRGLRRSEGKTACVLIDNVGLCQVFGLPVQSWNWEQMFRGKLSGKGFRDMSVKGEAMYASCVREEATDTDTSLELVISHEMLLEKLAELETMPAVKEKTSELRAWQDGVTGLWGLKRGREKMTEAVYSLVFGIRKGLAAVRFDDGSCGLVNETGQTQWRMEDCQSLKFDRHHILVVRIRGNRECYLDLYNQEMYEWKPTVKRYGNFELLKVRNRCYSRTKLPYISSMDFENLFISQKEFYLSIYEGMGKMFCLLAGDDEECYSFHRRMEDGSIVISDRNGSIYHVTKDGGKMYMGIQVSAKEKGEYQERIAQLNEDIRTRTMVAKEEWKRKIQAEQPYAAPYQSGLKWGLKVGNRITIPPIYRNVRKPIGNYCAVEKNFSQWGIVSIDGSILIEPKYTEVSIRENGTALLTQVTGKKVSVKLNGNQGTKKVNEL